MRRTPSPETTTPSSNWTHLHTVLAMAVVTELLYVGVALSSLRFAPHDSPFVERQFVERPILAVLGMFGVAFGAHLVALWAAVRTASQRGIVWAIVVPAVAFRLTMLPSWPIQEVDIYRYLWDGAVTTSQVSPFRYSPQQVLDLRSHPDRESLPEDLRQLVRLVERKPAMEHILQRVHFPGLPTIYPPVSQAVFAVTSLVTPSGASEYARLVIMKTVFVIFDLGTIALVLYMLKISGRHRGWSIAYAWSPLIMKEIPGSGHLDALAVFLATLAITIMCRALFAGPEDRSDPRRRRAVWLASGVLALATGAKLYPVVLAPLLLASCASRFGIRSAFAPALIFILLTAVILSPMLPLPQEQTPRVEHSADGHAAIPLPDTSDPLAIQDPSQGLVTFLRHFEMNDFLFMILVENLIPAGDTPPDQQPWFSWFPQRWRISLLGPVADAMHSRLKTAAFLVTRAVTSAVFVCVVIVVIWRTRATSDISTWLRGVFLTLAWFWLLSPTQNPWYWIWTMPFLAFTRGRAWLALSGLVLLYYLRFWFDYHWANQAGPGFPYTGTLYFDFVVTWIEFGPWFVWLGVAAIRRKNEDGRPKTEDGRTKTDDRRPKNDI